MNKKKKLIKFKNNISLDIHFIKIKFFSMFIQINKDNINFNKISILFELLL